MTRLATCEWTSPPPSAVDELLALYDDGTARLVVRTPRSATGIVGVFSCQPGDEDLRALTEARPGPIVFDLVHPPSDPADAALQAVADRVAALARDTPDAIATFSVAPLVSAPGGNRSIALLVVAAGSNAIEFQLDPIMSSVHFTSEGQPVAWQDLPPLPTGFVTPDAEGLGGVGRLAHIEPGSYGAIAFEVPAPADATEVSIRVAGWLRETLPDEPAPTPFEVMTPAARLNP